MISPVAAAGPTPLGARPDVHIPLHSHDAPEPSHAESNDEASVELHISAEGSAKLASETQDEARQASGGAAPGPAAPAHPAATSEGSSQTNLAYAASDANQDGVVTPLEQRAYEVAHPVVRHETASIEPSSLAAWAGAALQAA